MKAGTLPSDLALLDVKGAAARTIERALRSGTIDVVIRGRIVSAWGDHDGISQEFQVDVESVKTGGA